MTKYEEAKKTLDILRTIPEEALTEEHKQAIAGLEDTIRAVSEETVAGTLKVSAKGGVSLYGLGRFPVTLFKSQWPVILDDADRIRQFMKDNDKYLSDKADTPEDKAKKEALRMKVFGFTREQIEGKAKAKS